MGLGGTSSSAVDGEFAVDVRCAIRYEESNKLCNFVARPNRMMVEG
jgi:hypothetical protein